MMNKRKLLTAVLAAMVCSAGIAAPPAAKSETVKKVLTGTEKIAATRLLAAAAPGKVLKDWMTPGAYNRWQQGLGVLAKEDGSSPLVTDFFAHALLLVGPTNAQSGICAFYNPLQDNLLLFQTDNVDRVPRIEDFVFISGPSYRGETLKKGEYPRAIAPVKGDLDEILLKNTAAVAARFHKDFPDSAKSFSLARHRKMESIEDVCANAAFRLALLGKFVGKEAQADALKAGEIALLLWKGGESELKKAFDFPAGDDYGAKVYAALPPRVKTAMFPVLYFKNKQQGTLLGFGSRLLPEMLILIRIPAEAKAKPFFVCLPLSEKFVRNAQ